MKNHTHLVVKGQLLVFADYAPRKESQPRQLDVETFDKDASNRQIRITLIYAQKETKNKSITRSHGKLEKLNLKQS